MCISNTVLYLPDSLVMIITTSLGGPSSTVMPTTDTLYAVNGSKPPIITLVELPVVLTVADVASEGWAMV